MSFTTKRILIDSDHIKISKAGFDVESANPRDLWFNIDAKSFPIISRFSVNMNFGNYASGASMNVYQSFYYGTTFNHIPQALIKRNVSNSFYRTIQPMYLLFNSQSATVFSTTASSSGLMRAVAISYANRFDFVLMKYNNNDTVYAGSESFDVAVSNIGLRESQ